VAEIDWPDSDEAVIAVMRDKISEHHRLLRGNGEGREGIVEFIAQIRGQMKLIMGMLIFLTALGSIISAIVAIELAHKTNVGSDPAKIFHSNAGVPEVSSAQKLAGNESRQP